MSRITQVPDAIVFPGGTIRLVTRAAKDWAFNSTEIDRWCDFNTVPDYVDFDISVAQLMKNNGLVVRQERMPVGFYRSNRRRWPKSTVSGEVEVIGFLQRIPIEHRDNAMFRAYGRHRQRQLQETKKSAKPNKKPTKRKQS